MLYVADDDEIRFIEMVQRTEYSISLVGVIFCYLRLPAMSLGQLSIAADYAGYCQ